MQEPVCFWFTVTLRMQPLGFPSPECGAISLFYALNSVLDPSGLSEVLLSFSAYSPWLANSTVEVPPNTRLAGQAIALYS